MLSRKTRWMLALLIGSAMAYAKAETPVTEAAVEETTSAVTATEDGMVSVVGSNTPMARIVSQIDDASSATVRARGRAVNLKVTLILPKKTPLREALTQLAASAPDLLIYEPSDEPNTYEIWDQASYRREVLPKLVRPRVFQLKHLSAEEVGKAVDGMKTPDVGKVAFDPRSNKVFVTDLVPVLELMQRLIEEIDVGYISRVFQVRHADVEDLADKLKGLASPGAPEIISDKRTRQIIVQDQQGKIDAMEKLIEVLDIGGDHAATGTPLRGWKITAAAADEVTMVGPDDKPVRLPVGQAVGLNGMGRTPSVRVTLKGFTGAPTSATREAVLTVEPLPVEVTLPVSI